MGNPILPGAEPQSWPGGPGGALVLHGFTGSPQSMRSLAQALAGVGLAVELPRLPGHGTSLDDMVPTRWEHWAEVAEEAYTGLAARCRGVIVVGLSMGGTLACWLAARHPEVAGVVAVNPFVESPAPSFLDLLSGLADAGFEVAPTGIGSDIADPEASELTYEGTPIRAAMSLFEATASLDLAPIACPVLLFQSRQDHVVPPPSGDLLVRATGGPVERVWLERSYHVATLDYDHTEIESRTVAFARNMLG
ncbi:MAG: alpha/beta hydrolase [Acidimicrobiales bacterium]